MTSMTTKASLLDCSIGMNTDTIVLAVFGGQQDSKASILACMESLYV